LTGVSENFYKNGIVTRAPQASADTVLTVSVDMQMPMALDHSLLYEFFQNPRFNPLSVFFAGYFMGRHVIVYILIAHGNSVRK
jgi:hypothetical protein